MSGVRVPFHRASFGDVERRYACEALESGEVAWGGRYSRRAQELLRALQDGRPVLLTPSCTLALELAARLLELQPGDEVIVPAYTFISTASAFALHGATPVFADVRPDTLTLDLDAVGAAITPRTRAICPVHYNGVAPDPDRFVELAAQHGLVVVEDNAQGLGAGYRCRPLGTFGALSALSFDHQKNLTSGGEGGALTINDPDLAARAEVLQDRGTNRASFMRGEVGSYTWVDIGSNWSMSDLAAAVLVGQLERFEEIQARRHALWQRYAQELRCWAGEAVRLPLVPAGVVHSAHLFHLRLPSAAARDRFIAHLRERGVQASFHYQALNVSEVGQRFGGRPGACPVAEEAAATLVRLPLYPSLGDDEQSYVIEAVTSFDVAGV